MKHLAQRGATLIEFALGLILFLMLLLGVVDFSRMLYTWAAANEAARAGARYAVVCDDTTQKAKVLAYMQTWLPEISDIATSWNPASCTAATCQGVTVTITNLQFQWISPLAGLGLRSAIPMPSFSTYLPREVMRQDPNSSTACAS